MAECILLKSGGGTGSDECTATKANVLSGCTAVTKDSDDEAVAGTMANKGAWTSRIGVNGKAVIPEGYHNGKGYVDQAITNRGAVNASLPINGTYTIPEGYHSGAGKVTQNIATMGAQTVTPGNSQKVVSCSGKYMTGDVTVPAVTNLIAANIKKGVNVGGVVGTWEGYVAAATDIYNRGATKYGVTVNSGYGVMESNCIRLYNTSGEIYTTQAINLTGYSEMEVTISSDSTTAGVGSIRVYRGRSSAASNLLGTSDSTHSFGSTQSPVTIRIPFTGNHSISDVITIKYSRNSGNERLLFYRISLY